MDKMPALFLRVMEAIVILGFLFATLSSILWDEQHFAHAQHSQIMSLLLMILLRLVLIYQSLQRKSA